MNKNNFNSSAWVYFPAICYDFDKRTGKERDFASLKTSTANDNPVPSNPSQLVHFSLTKRSLYALWAFNAVTTAVFIALLIFFFKHY